MKRVILVLIFLSGFLYSGTLQSNDCNDCKKLKDELRKAEDFNLKVIRELRATVKELTQASANIRKLQCQSSF